MTGLGLPEGIRACLFDLDGVLTPTADLHAAAWQEVFDGFLHEHSERTGERFVPFDVEADYHDYVDGRPRAGGTRAFLTSRHIGLPEGRRGDPPEALTVEGVAARKDAVFERMLASRGIRAYPDAVRYLRAAREAGLRRAVVSSSRHCAELLRAAGIDDLVELRVDGVVADEQGLAGKPAPDMFLAASRGLGVSPGEAAAFEDSFVGVQAARAGGFGYLVGVDRDGARRAGLRERGADVVVAGLDELAERG